MGMIFRVCHATNCLLLHYKYFFKIFLEEQLTLCFRTVYRRCEWKREKQMVFNVFRGTKFFILFIQKRAFDNFAFIYLIDVIIK